MTVALEVTTDPPAAATSMVPEEVTTDVVQEMSTRLYTEAFTAAANTVAPEPLTTSAPATFVVETEGPAETEQPIVTGAADSEMSEEVVVEGDTAGEEWAGWRLGWCRFWQFEFRCCFWLVWCDVMRVQEHTLKVTSHISPPAFPFCLFQSFSEFLFLQTDRWH